MRRFLRLLLLVSFLSSTRLFAHGDLDEQILAVTAKIQQEPKNIEWYLKRAELYRTHGEWEKALADCETVEKLDAKAVFTNYLRAKIFFDSEKYESVLKSVDAFLAEHPDHSEALLLRARSLVKLGKNAAAAVHFTKAIELMRTPEPDYFLERARALLAENKLDEAVHGLDEGIQKIGPIVSLELLAIELETRLGRYESALARVEKMMAAAPRKESWLALRGETLEAAGRKKEAREAFLQALDAITSLPVNRRGTPFVVQIESRTRDALERLAKNEK